MAREPLNVTIPNCTIDYYYHSTTGQFYAYRITPNAGYCLHDSMYDMDEGELKLGYCTNTSSCGYNYDFTTSIVDGYTAYGSRKFFARPISEVPSDQIFGGGNNDHEII